MSGYRSIARFKQRPLDFGFELELERGELLPGGTGVGRLSFWAADDYRNSQSPKGSSYEKALAS